MAPLSFQPLAEASFSLFSQFPALLPGEVQTRLRCGSALALLPDGSVSCFRGGTGGGGATGSGAEVLRSEQVLVKACVCGDGRQIPGQA